MPRAKGGFKAKRYHKKVLENAKGYYGARSRLYRIATQAVDKALVAAYKDRKLKKREFRALWIARINAAVRSLDMSYSQFMNGLKKANITLNRKALADLAYNDFNAFTKLVEQVAQKK
ncbi:MAG TPA: 50S ribosomal protein L20 [Dissulfurispiraceae bacterium]